jgi:hypothetical protein
MHAARMAPSTAFHQAMRLNIGSAIMPAETLSRVLAEQLHPAAQVIPALVNLNMPPTGLRRNQARCLRWVKLRSLSAQLGSPLYPQ